MPPPLSPQAARTGNSATTSWWKDGYLSVYYGADRTFYAYTDIRYDMLDEATRQQIQQGLSFTDERTLYDFLENFLIRRRREGSFLPLPNPCATMCLVKKMRTEDKVYQVAVIGGGASGMLAAIAAARRQASVLLLEQNEPARKEAAFHRQRKM